MRRLNSSCKRSIALKVRGDFNFRFMITAAGRRRRAKLAKGSCRHSLLEWPAEGWRFPINIRDACDGGWQWNRQH